MLKMIAGASVLVVAVMMIRRLTKGRISMRLRYALWIMVALRLVVPGSIGSSPLSVMSLRKMAEPYIEKTVQHMHKESADVAGNAGRAEFAGIAGNAEGKESAVGGIESADGAEYTVGNDENGSAEGIGETDIGSEQGLKQPEMESLGNESSLSMQTAGRQRLLESGRYFVVLVGIWIVGIVVTGGCMAVGQLRFISYLHRARQEAVLNEIPHEWGVRLKEHRMHVYTVQGLPGPCMAGRGIYISPELCSRKDELLHVLAHEYSHAVQGDNCWAFLRCILCMVYWFHPFVWLAAYASKQDSELACDERAIGLLGEAERFAYGRTLLGLAFDGQSRQPYIGAVLMMNDSAGKVKERVSVIAETKKKNGVTVGIVILIAVLTCGCAFTGAVQPDAVMEMEEAQRKEEAAMRAEAEEIEQMENAAIASRFDEIEQEKVQEEQRMESMRAEAEEIERMEQEQIRKYLEELEAKAQVIETALEAKRQEAQSLHTSGAEGELRIEVETKEAALREELDEVNSLMQEIKEEWQQATAGGVGFIKTKSTESKYTGCIQRGMAAAE